MFDCYKGKRVLVTGDTGFKGSWLTLWLLKMGAEVAGLSVDIPTTPSLFQVLSLEKDIQQYWVDVRDADVVEKAFQAFQPEFVFHLAAQPIVSQSFKNPQQTFETNIMGMVNVLHAMKSVDSVRSAVLITSDKCYENVEWAYGYREVDRLGGKDPYSASKACAEIVARSYWYSYFKGNRSTAYATTRAGNVIGGGDWAADRLVPDVVRSWSQQQELIIRSPHATRPWQHVLEPLSGYLCLGEQLWKAAEKFNGEAYNFGPREGMMKSVGEVVETLAQFWPKSQWKIVENEALKESSLLKLDCSKAQHELNWNAALDFRQTIEFTAEWYKAYYQQSGNIKDFTLNQIKQYQQLAKDRGIAWAM